MDMPPDKQKEYGAGCVAVGLLFLADYFMGKGKSKDEALTLSAEVVKQKAHGLADILRD